MKGHTMKLTMLGTGHAMVTECYNTCFALQDEGKYFLIDCGGGNGILRQLKRAGIPVTDIRDLFITHRHVDHMTGFVWILRSFLAGFRSGRLEGELRVYGHDEVMHIADRMASYFFTEQEYDVFKERVKLIEVHDGESFEIIGHKVTFFDIQSNKAKQFGFRIMLDDERWLTCLGDEAYHDCCEKYVLDAEWLMHEAFCLSTGNIRFDPKEKYHSTVADACAAAEELGVHNLILYHTEDSDLPGRKQAYTAEGRTVFSGRLYVPDDLETIVLE